MVLLHLNLIFSERRGYADSFHRMKSAEKTHSPIFQWTKKNTQADSHSEEKTVTKGNARIVRKSEHLCADCRKGRIRANKLNITLRTIAHV